MLQPTTTLDRPPRELSVRAREHCFDYLSRLLGLSVNEHSEQFEKLAAVLLRVSEYETPAPYHNLKSETSEPLLEKLMASRGAKCVWPEGKRFALCLTHDVDHLRVTAHVERLRALWAVRGMSIRERTDLCASVGRHALRAMVSGVRHYPLEMWLRAEDEFGFRSTFYFMGGPPARPDARDIYYRLDDGILCEGKLRPLREILPTLVEGGWEVGMHGSIASAFDVEIARTERLRLCEAAGTDVISGRQHYLNFDIRSTPLIHEAAGLRTDSTLGSNVLPECHRIGTGLPFPMFHLLEDRPLNLVQVPLIVHDNPLLSAADGDAARAVEIATRQMKSAAERGGMVTLLFHPNYLESSTAFRVYREILAVANDLGAWGCPAGDAARWFGEQHQSMPKAAA